MDWKNIIDSCSDEIKQSSEETKDLFTLNGTTHAAKIFRVYDGDSFYMNIILHGKLTTFKCRLNKVDTPEMRSQNELEKELARIAKARVRGLINDKVVCVTCGEFDKYGRVLVDITLDTGDDLGNILIKERLAFVYDGGTKRTDWVSLHTEMLIYNDVTK
jgi:endonuclease YncB( thermonuclease family)